MSDRTVSGGSRGPQQERLPQRGQVGRASWRKCHLGPAVSQVEAGRGASIESTAGKQMPGSWDTRGQSRSTHVFWEQQRVVSSARTLNVLQSKVTVKAGVRVSECPGRGRLTLPEGCYSGHPAVHAGPSLGATWCPREGWGLRSAGVRSPILPAVWPWAGLAPPLSQRDDLLEDPTVLRIHRPPPAGPGLDSESGWVWDGEGGKENRLCAAAGSSHKLGESGGAALGLRALSSRWAPWPLRRQGPWPLRTS